MNKTLLLYFSVENLRNDILPELSGALLLWASKNRMRLTGLERIDKADYAQTWSIEVL